MSTYVQLRFSRTDGRSWSTGLSGLGSHLVEEAREMAKCLTKSCDYVEVIIEDRQGAESANTKCHLWSARNGWSSK